MDEMPALEEMVERVGAGWDMTRGEGELDERRRVGGTRCGVRGRRRGKEVQTKKSRS